MLKIQLFKLKKGKFKIILKFLFFLIFVFLLLAFLFDISFKKLNLNDFFHIKSNSN